MENNYRLYINTNNGYDEFARADLDVILKIMDKMILRKQICAKYLVIENDGLGDNPIYLGSGNVNHYLEFKDSFKQKVKRR